MPTRVASGYWSRRSHDHDAARARILAVAEGREDRPRVERQEFLHACTERPQRGAVGPGVGDEEDEVTVGIVAQLQRQPALERLAVGDPSLALDASSPWVGVAVADLGVPGPQVAVDREGHFGSPAQGRIEARPKALEERKLRPIPDRITGRIGSHRQIEPDDRAVSGHELKRGITYRASFESADLGMRDADGFRHSSLAQAGGRPSLSPVDPHPLQGFAAAPPAPIGSSLVRWHFSPIVPPTSAHRVIAPFLEHPAIIPASGDPSEPYSVLPRPLLERPAFHLATEAVRMATSNFSARRSERRAFQQGDGRREAAARREL